MMSHLRWSSLCTSTSQSLQHQSSHRPINLVIAAIFRIKRIERLLNLWAVPRQLRSILYSQDWSLRLKLHRSDQKSLYGAVAKTVGAVMAKRAVKKFLIKSVLSINFPNFLVAITIPLLSVSMVWYLPGEEEFSANLAMVTQKITHYQLPLNLL